MQKIHYVLIFCFLALFSSCKDDKTDPDPTLSVSPNAAINFTAGAQPSEAVTITVTTNQASWDAVSNQTWCNVTKDVANNRFTVSATPNTATTSPPDATITVKAGDATPVTIAVTQNAAPAATLVLTSDELTIGFDNAGTSTIAVTTNQPTWSFTKPDDAGWLTVTKDGNSLKLIAEANEEGERSADITVTTGTAGNTTSVTVKVVQTANPLRIQYVDIPAGTFMMGSPATEPGRDPKETQHRVTLSAFRMSKYEVTNAQFAAFLNAKKVGSDGKLETAGYGLRTILLVHNKIGVYYNDKTNQWEPAADKENYPAVNIYWYGAVEFARWVGASLPTEAQWEYACRGNQQESRPFGIGEGTMLDNTMAVFNWQFCYALPDGQYVTSIPMPGTTKPVGSYSPNSYGLYNMHGNVAEWCSDWHTNYTSAEVDNPTGPETGSYKVIRGGSYQNMSQYCRSAARRSSAPGDVTSNEGFRVVKQ